MMLGLSRTAGFIGSEILLMLIDTDRTDPDPVKNEKLYKRGDVVEVMVPAAHDGNLVANPIQSPWWLLRVVGIPRAIAMKYLGEKKTATAVTRRRTFGVTYASLPTAVQTALTNTRYAVVQWNTLRLAMKNKDTNQPEP